MGRLEIDENSSVRVGRQHEGHLVLRKSVVRTHEGHIVEMTDIPVIMKAVVNKRQGDKLVYGVAEIPMPIVSDEKDLIIKVEAAPINPVTWAVSACSPGLLPIALQLGRLRSPSQFLFPQALEGMFKADGDMKLVGRICWPLALTTWRHPPSIRRAPVLSSTLRHSLHRALEPLCC